VQSCDGMKCHYLMMTMLLLRMDLKIESSVKRSNLFLLRRRTQRSDGRSVAMYRLMNDVRRMVLLGLGRLGDRLSGVGSRFALANPVVDARCYLLCEEAAEPGADVSFRSASWKSYCSTTVFMGWCV